MSLFNRLLSLNAGNIPLEDFFTEIVAHLFSEHKHLLLAWLKELDLLDPNHYIDAQVSTQQSLKALPHHKSGSRPDIVIHLEKEVGDSYDLIFIESKIGSHEGENQLSRYAEHLHSFNNYNHRILIYITRDFEPKVKDEIFKNIPSPKVKFVQLRWYQFYQFLLSYQDSHLIHETILFMKEHDMAHNNQFSPIDILTLSNLLNSLQMMEQVMSGSVRSKFEKTIGKLNSPTLSRLQRDKVYFWSREISSGFSCLIGFNLNSSTVTDYPKVSFHLQVNPDAPFREKIILAMQAICRKSVNWHGYELDEKSWSGIIREKSLRSFLAEEDHIVAIETFFLEVLGELEHLKNQYPELPWK